MDTTQNNSTNPNVDKLDIKKKKKSKKMSYKKLMKKLMKPKYTDEEIKQRHLEKISKSLGGGTFQKNVII